ncbi:MAG TPA: winged helix-turn-helix domain-containing protein [Planctomycetota bacterium]|nr:winged helix-turn-helix domain-containing protein [Planctomycetota bacterium]
MSTDVVVNNMGTAAGAVWEVLAANGPVALDWLCRAARLSESDANRGIGWLAREGKLSLERRGHRREVRVSKAAERVRQLLLSRGPMLLVRATQAAAIPEDLAQQGLGWLAREGRIELNRVADGRKVEVGRAAAAVWQLVRSRGTVARRDIPRATGLTPGLANAAIGWLVREGKLVVEDRCEDRSAGSEPAVRAALPSPADGTLTLEEKGRGTGVPIGEAAGVIWRALDLQGYLTAEELSLETGLAEDRLNQGIGWLAREGKLSVGRDRKGQEWFRLNGAC